MKRLFVSYVYTLPSGDIRLANGCVPFKDDGKTHPIHNLDDVRKIEEEFKKVLCAENIAILSFQEIDDE